MSFTSPRPRGRTAPSRPSTSAVLRMIATGVRSSWDAAATNRRSRSNAARIGTRARRVTTIVTIAAPSRPPNPTIRMAVNSVRDCSSWRESTNPGLERVDIRRLRSGDSKREQANARLADLDGPQVAAAQHRGGERVVVRQPEQHHALRVRDDRTGLVQVQEERVCGRGRVVGVRRVHGPTRGRIGLCRPTVARPPPLGAAFFAGSGRQPA